MITITPRNLAEIAVLDLEGRLIGDACNQFLATITPQIVEGGARKFILNFARLQQCDSMGISAILRIHGSLENMGGRLVICNANDLIMKVFALTRMDSVLHLADTEAEALDAFGAPVELQIGG